MLSSLRQIQLEPEAFLDPRRKREIVTFAGRDRQQRTVQAHSVHYEFLLIKVNPAGRRLKPRNIRERQLAAGDVHTAEFGAAVEHRKHLTGVEQALLVVG